MRPADVDVAVIGMGPAGATCANLLGSMGVRTLVVDKSRSVYEMPRAFALDHEILRTFQNLGLADTISPHTRPFTPSEYYGAQGQLIKRLGSAGFDPAPFKERLRSSAAAKTAAIADAEVAVRQEALK